MKLNTRQSIGGLAVKTLSAISPHNALFRAMGGAVLGGILPGAIPNLSTQFIVLALVKATETGVAMKIIEQTLEVRMAVEYVRDVTVGIVALTLPHMLTIPGRSQQFSGAVGVAVTILIIDGVVDKNAMGPVPIGAMTGLALTALLEEHGYQPTYGVKVMTVVAAVAVTALSIATEWKMPQMLVGSLVPQFSGGAKMVGVGLAVTCIYASISVGDACDDDNAADNIDYTIDYTGDGNVIDAWH